MANKYAKVMSETDSSKVYAKARKGYLAYSVGKINCSFCPYHRKENGHKLQRSWKRATKRRKQYKGK